MERLGRPADTPSARSRSAERPPRASARWCVRSDSPAAWMVARCRAIGPESRPSTPKIAPWHLEAGEAKFWCLGVDLAPLPFVYAALVVLWATVVAVWLTNVFKYRRQNVLLQRGLTVVPCAKLLGVVLRAYYFGKGHLTGELPQAALYFFHIVYIIYKGVFFAALLLISKGWLITRPSLEKSTVVSSS